MREIYNAEDRTHAEKAVKAFAMVFKLAESAQDRWRAITGARLIPLVRSGARFDIGVLAEREEQGTAA